jgi:hypothetical protein
MVTVFVHPDAFVASKILQVVEKKVIGMVGDAGFEPVTSTVGAQKEGEAKNISGNLRKMMIFQLVRFSIYLDIFASSTLETSGRYLSGDRWNMS